MAEWSVQLDRGCLTLIASRQPGPWNGILLGLEIEQDGVNGEVRCVLSPRELRAIARLMGEAVRAMEADDGPLVSPHA